MAVGLTCRKSDAGRVGADGDAIEGEVSRLNLPEEPPRCDESYPGCIAWTAWNQWSLDEGQVTEAVERKFGGVAGWSAATSRCPGHSLEVDEKCRREVAMIEDHLLTGYAEIAVNGPVASLP